MGSLDSRHHPYKKGTQPVAQEEVVEPQTFASDMTPCSQPECPAASAAAPCGPSHPERHRSTGSGLASERVCQGSDLSPFQRPK